jgi:D-glycero-D-manno-heptose 1,7-bisphosphate phosphatase
MTPTRACDKVVILDRDGTLVIDRGYLADPAGLEFEASAANALRLLYSRGYRLVVVTNQSGVGRGFFPRERVLEMNDRLLAMAGEIGVKIEGIYFCPHAPEAGCECRKPAQGLMRQAAAELGFDPARAFVIGDQETDVEFGRNAGATTLLIAVQPSSEGAPSAADHIVPDLMAAALAVTSVRD